MQDNLLRELAPPIAPDHLSAWPPGPGWIILLGLCLLGLLVGAVYISRRWPWWRWPRVWRWRRLYHQALERDVLHSSAHSGAVNQWVRQLARDGLGIDTTLPPEHFLHQLQRQLVTLNSTPDERIISTLRHLLLQSYQPSVVHQTLDNETTSEILQTLCKRCLTLHSPGPG